MGLQADGTNNITTKDSKKKYYKSPISPKSTRLLEKTYVTNKERLFLKSGYI